MKFKKLGALILGALLSIGVAAGVGATVEKDVAYAADTNIVFNLGANGDASHYDYTTSKTSYSETVDGYTLSITGGSSMYPGSRDAKGNSCIKFGTNSKAGSCSFTVHNDITSVILAVGKYKTNTTKVTINGTTTTLTKSSNDGAYDEITVDTSSTKTISFTTVSGGYRAMLNTITWVTKTQEPDQPDSKEQTINATADSVEVDGNITLETNAESATWSLSNENAALSPETGKEVTLTGVTAGTVVVTAKADGYTDATITITVTAKESGGDGDDSGDITVPSEPIKYTFADYPAGTQYADETHELDDYLIVYTTQCHFTSELRIYSSSTNNGNAIFEAADGLKISAITINAGNKVDTLNIYGSNSNDSFTSETVGTISVTSTSYKDYSINFADSDQYRCLKLDVAGTNQVRIKYITITFVAETTEDPGTQEKIIESIDGIATQPTKIYQGSQINVNDFTFNVTYNDKSKGVVKADSIDLSTENVGEVTATAHFGNITFNFVVTVEKNDIDSFSWTSRDLSNKITFEGTKISEVVNINEWKFTVTYKNGSTETYTGINDTVRVAFYDSDKPTVENTDYITEDYELTLEHNGKFLVACYKGEKFSGSNTESKVTVIESLNSINYTSLEAEKTLTFDNVSKRTEFSASKQVWEENGVTFTNNKSASTTNVADYAAPVRLYAKSGIVVEAVGMSQIIFDCNSSDYATELKNSIGDSATASSDKVTVSFDEAVDTFTVESLTAQVRLDAITVIGSGETVVELANKNITAQASIIDFAKRFNAALADVCALSAKGQTADFNDSWGVAKTAYDETIGALTGDDKTFAENMIKYATATWQNADVLQQALKTYEVVVGYGMEPFLGEVRNVSSSNPFAINALVNDSTTLVLIVVGMAAILGFAFFYYTKRKERKIEF